MDVGVAPAPTDARETPKKGPRANEAVAKGEGLGIDQKESIVQRAHDHVGEVDSAGQPLNARGCGAGPASEPCRFRSICETRRNLRTARRQKQLT